MVNLRSRKDLHAGVSFPILYALVSLSTSQFSPSRWILLIIARHYCGTKGEIDKVSRYRRDSQIKTIGRSKKYLSFPFRFYLISQLFRQHSACILSFLLRVRLFWKKEYIVLYILPICHKIITENEKESDCY